MMKPLLTAAALAFSLAALSGSVPASAETTVTNGVPFGLGGFVFFDPRLNSQIFPPESGFATLELSALYETGLSGSRVYLLQTYIDPGNPFIPNPGTTVTQQTYDYYMNPSGEAFLEREQYASYEGDITSRFWVYLKDTDNSVSHINLKAGEYNSTAPFDRDELRSEAYSDLPLSAFGIFDFEKSLVYYAGETEGVSMAQVFAQIFASGQPASPYVALEVFPTTNQLKFLWVDEREIVGISLAYNLPVPEPETWAMLLAGLGVVGMATRKRQAGTVA